jgi:hypothetical protein
MAFSIRLSDEEKQLAESYAKLHSMSLGEAFKRALFEKIEDEYDLQVYNEAKTEFEKNPVTYSLEEVEEELGIK